MKRLYRNVLKFDYAAVSALILQYKMDIFSKEEKTIVD